jgi:Ni/Fe-hydrogenase 1 B-type cytochrome subunit
VVKQLLEYHVWDKATRIFHWVNVLAILILIAVGVAILNASALGVSGEGKVLLKTIHVYAGYVFALNLLWRLGWGFWGGRYARWGALLPLGKGYVQSLKDYISGAKTSYLGHNPLGRLAVTALLLSLTTQMVTGLVLAGTDIYYPPLGGWISNWIAAPGVDPATLVPGVRDMLNPDAYAEMRSFRSPFIETHEIAFYVTLGLILLHISAVVWTDIRHGGSLVSAMFTGKKVLSEVPEDAPEEGSESR